MYDRAARLPARLLEITTALLAGFQLYGTWAVRRGWTFSDLLTWLPLALLVALAMGWALGPVLAEDPPEVDEASPVRIPVLAAVGTGLLGVLASWGWYAWSWPWWSVWGLLVAHTLLLGQGLPVLRAQAVRIGPRGSVALVLACLLGSVTTLWLHVPEADDAYYLNQVIATVEHPDLPLLSFDGMHGDVRAPIQQVGHRGSLWETLGSVVTWATGHPGGDAYYIYIPPVTAALSILTVWVLGTLLLGPRAGLLAAFAYTFVSITWGGHYYAYGGYTFGRIYQGKGAAYTFALPLCAIFGLRFGAQPTWRTASWVALAQLTAALTTSSALVLAPVTAALGALVGLRPDRHGLKVAGLGALSALPVVAMLFLVKFDMDALPKPSFAGEDLEQLVLFGGEGIRLFLAPAFLFGLPALARLVGAGLFLRYLLVAAVVLFNGWFTHFLGEHAGAHLSWRGYWAVPLNLLFALGGAAAVEALWQRPRDWRRWVVGTNTVALLVCFALAGRWAFVDLQWARWKVPGRALDVANAVVGHSQPDSLALLTTHIAERTTGLQGRPQIVNARRPYMRNLERHFGRRESRARQYLLRFVDHGREVEYGWALDELDRRCIDIVVPSPKAHRKHPQLHRDLEQRGFTSETYDVFRLYVRPRSACSR